MGELTNRSAQGAMYRSARYTRCGAPKIDGTPLQQNALAELAQILDGIEDSSSSRQVRSTIVKCWFYTLVEYIYH